MNCSLTAGFVSVARLDFASFSLSSRFFSLAICSIFFHTGKWHSAVQLDALSLLSPTMLEGGFRWGGMGSTTPVLAESTLCEKRLPSSIHSLHSTPFISAQYLKCASILLMALD